MNKVPFLLNNEGVLLQQHHLLGLSELASLYGVQVQASTDQLSCIVGGIPLDRFIASGLLTIH
jgi:hypothetical protein